MICPTCHGKGCVTVPYMAGVADAHYPCPDCHAGCQHCCEGREVEIDGVTYVLKAKECCDE